MELVDPRGRLESMSQRLSTAGYDVRPLVFAPPAADSDIRALEADLNVELPASLRRVLTMVSAHVEFRWFAPKETTYAKPFHQNFSGDLHWSVKWLRQFNTAKERWIKSVFPNPDDPYDRVWHRKLAFHEVGNGDYIALDLAPATHGRVVYLSHDDGQGHGHVLADSFTDLLERWVPLACPGGEDWQWLPFTSPTDSRIDPDSENGKRWRAVLGLLDD